MSWHIKSFHFCEYIILYQLTAKWELNYRWRPQMSSFDNNAKIFTLLSSRRKKPESIHNQEAAIRELTNYLII